MAVSTQLRQAIGMCTACSADSWRVVRCMQVVSKLHIVHIDSAIAAGTHDMPSDALLANRQMLRLLLQRNTLVCSQTEVCVIML